MKKGYLAVVQLPSTGTAVASVDSAKFPQAAARKRKNSDIPVATAAAFDALMAASLVVWPDNTPAYLAAAARVHMRRAEQWLERKTNPSGPALIALLHSAHGDVFYFAIMQHAAPVPTHWERLGKEIRRTQLRAQLKDLGD